MENYRFLKYIPLLVLMLWPYVFVDAYAVSTHKNLTKNILQEYQRISHTRFSNKEMQAIILGSEFEDALSRPINHFYDPVNNHGLDYSLLNEPRSIDWATNPYIQGNFIGISYKKFFKNKETKLFEYNNDYTWQRAIYEYVHGDKERAMRSLGQVMHLLEDLTSVPHTRNDAHGGWGRGGTSVYEEYTAGKSSNVKLSKMLKLQSIDDIFNQTARYTNNNFLSVDTVFKIFDKPKSEAKKIDNNLYMINSIGAKLVFVDGFKDKNKKIIVNDYVLDPQVMQSYWEHLSYKAVESGVALMDLFFREVEKERQTGELAYMNKSYSEVQSIANTMQGFKGVKALLGSSLTATEAYELNKDEWEGARRAARFYGIDFPPRPIGVKKPISKETERTLTQGQVGAAALAVIPTQESLELEPTPQPVLEPQTQQVAPSSPPIPESEPTVEPESVSTSTIESTPDITSEPVIPIILELTPPIEPEPTPVVVTPPPAPNPSPFDPGGFAFGGGGGSGSSTSPAPTPPPDTTAPEVVFNINGCYFSSQSDCKVIPGQTITYSWETPDTDLKEFSINNGETIDVSQESSGSATIVLSNNGDTKTISITAEDNSGNTQTVSKILTAGVPSIVINEIAWAGTENNPGDEWIELYNNEDYKIDLTNMQLEVVDSDITIDLQGSISAKSYYLIESSQEATSATADLIADFGNGLIDFGDTVRISSGSQVVDEVTPNNSGRWRYGGSDSGASTHTMERFLPEGSSNDDTNWYISSHYLVQYTNRDGDDLYGTPGSRNTINYRFTYNNQVNNTELTIDSSRSPYKFENFYIPSGKKLTITEGVQIDFLDRYKGYITVRGELITQGTQKNKIIFNNRSGPDWEGIQVSSGGVLNMQYTDINKAGSKLGAYTDASIEVDNGSIVLDNVNIHNSASSGLYLKDITSTQISNSTISDSARVGVYINNGVVDINSLTINYSGDNGLYLGTGITGASVKNSIFDNNTNIAFLNNTSNIIEYSNNSGTGNGINGIYLDGLWLKNDDTTTLQYNSLPYTLSWLTIKDTQTLSLNEGVIIKGTPVGSSGGKSKIVIEEGGVLNLNGTDDNPVVFTTLNDSDNNPQDGDWWGIEVQSGGVVQGASTTNAVIKYADVATPMPW